MDEKKEKDRLVDIGREEEKKKKKKKKKKGEEAQGGWGRGGDHHGRSRGTMSDGIVGAIAISLFGIGPTRIFCFVYSFGGKIFHSSKPRSRQREETSRQHGCWLHDTRQRYRCLQNVRPIFLQG